MRSTLPKLPVNEMMKVWVWLIEPHNILDISILFSTLFHNHTLSLKFHISVFDNWSITQILDHLDQTSHAKLKSLLLSLNHHHYWLRLVWSSKIVIKSLFELCFGSFSWSFVDHTLGLSPIGLHVIKNSFWSHHSSYYSLIIDC